MSLLNDFSKEFLEHGRKIVHGFPTFIFTLLILFFFWVGARLVYRLVLIVSRRRGGPSLLHEVIARVVSFLIFIFGLYLIFEIIGLTTIAVTLMSGTGIVGIVLGIAFRDITENFLASLLLSMQNPFRVGDLIDVVAPATGYAVTGYVEGLTLRVTMLILPDGNHLQIPNAVVYKSNIRNYSTDPRRREDLIITLSINTSVAEAVASSLEVLKTNPAVLEEPEPIVLVEKLMKDQLDLHIYYWIDMNQQNGLKVRSLLLESIHRNQSVRALGAKEKIYAR